MEDDTDEYVRAILQSTAIEDTPPAPLEEELGEEPGTVVSDYFHPEEEVVISSDPESLIQGLLSIPQASRVIVEDLVLVKGATREFVEAILRVESIRAKFVRDLILSKGWVTTEEVSKTYDPTAIRDLEESGVNLGRKMVSVASGKRCMKYWLDPAKFKEWKESRHPLSKKDRDSLFGQQGGRCSICGIQGELQADHRVPFAMVGNTLAQVEGLEAYQGLCPSCNTRKADVCGSCLQTLDCKGCYWAYPKNYTHVACLNLVVLNLSAFSGTPQADLIQLVKNEAKKLGILQ